MISKRSYLKFNEQFNQYLRGDIYAPGLMWGSGEAEKMTQIGL